MNISKSISRNWNGLGFGKYFFKYVEILSFELEEFKD